MFEDKPKPLPESFSMNDFEERHKRVLQMQSNRMRNINRLTVALHYLKVLKDHDCYFQLEMREAVEFAIKLIEDELRKEEL